MMKVLLTIALLVLVFPSAAWGASGACSEAQAKKEMNNALKKYREAQKVYKNTVLYNKKYGKNTGRWVKLSRGTGWTWNQMPMLMMVIHRESRGNPSVVNYIGCTGLLQIHPCHGKSIKWLQVPRNNLKFGKKLHKSSGWTPWAM